MLKDLYRHLSIHNGVGLFVSQLAADEEVTLTEFVEERIERQTIVDILLNSCQVREAFNRIFEEIFIVDSHSEILDKLWDGKNLEH